MTMISEILAEQNEQELRSMLADLRARVEPIAEAIAENPDWASDPQVCEDLLGSIPYLMRAVELLAARKS